MTTRTQIIEGLKAAKHGHVPFCAVQVHAPCNCGADGRNARIDAAIAELEKQPAVQAETYKCVRCKDTGEIAWYPDEAPCPDCTGARPEAVQAEPVAWRYRLKGASGRSWHFTAWAEFESSPDGEKYEFQPLYAHPPSKGHDHDEVTIT